MRLCLTCVSRFNRQNHGRFERHHSDSIALGDVSMGSWRICKTIRSRASFPTNNSAESLDGSLEVWSFFFIGSVASLYSKLFDDNINNRQKKPYLEVFNQALRDIFAAVSRLQDSMCQAELSEWQSLLMVVRKSAQVKRMHPPLDPLSLLSLFAGGIINNYQPRPECHREVFDSLPNGRHLGERGKCFSLLSPHPSLVRNPWLRERAD